MFQRTFLLCPRDAQRDASIEPIGSTGCFNNITYLLIASWTWFQDRMWQIAKSRYRGISVKYTSFAHHMGQPGFVPSRWRLEMVFLRGGERLYNDLAGDIIIAEHTVGEHTRIGIREERNIWQKRFRRRCSGQEKTGSIS